MQMRHTLITDASFNHTTGVTGIGIAIHETDRPRRNGVLIDQIAEAYSGILDGHGKTLAVYRALELSLQRGFSVLRIRTDAKCVRKPLKRDLKERTGFDRLDFHGEILRMTRQFESVTFSVKQRRKNQMAHGLARTGAKELEPVIRPELVEISKQPRTGSQQEKKANKPSEAIQVVDAPTGWTRMHGDRGVRVTIQNPTETVHHPKLGDYKPAYTFFLLPLNWEGTNVLGGKFADGRFTDVPLTRPQQTCPAQFRKAFTSVYVFDDSIGTGSWKEPFVALEQWFEKGR